MALRSQKTTRAAIVIGLWLAPALFAQREFRFEVRHHHWRKDGAGTLVISERGISFQEFKKGKKAKHAGQWDYRDIQELKLSPSKLTIVTYKDRKWLLGMDQEYEFRLTGGRDFREVYEFMKNRLDQRFVAALAEPGFQPLWEIPVKLLGRIYGSEGVLQVGADHIIYKTGREEQSRTWRFRDIENISSSGPFQLTITTFERAKTHYGNRKAFNFQLKEALDEKRYDILWRRLNQSKGLRLLTSIEQRQGK